MPTVPRLGEPRLGWQRPDGSNGGPASVAYGTPGTTAVGVVNPDPSLTYNYDSAGHLQAVNSDGTVVYSDNQSSSLPGVPDNPNP